MVDNVHFSSASDMWATPKILYAKLDGIFGFETDVCAVATNACCNKYYSPEIDGLSQEWRGVCWMNPPYGRNIGAWVAKAYTAAEKNSATVVCLLPARTDTAWWQDYCMKGSIWLIRGRLKFGAAKHSAPFPSAIVIFHPVLINPA